MGTFVSSRQVRQNINLMTPWWLSGASIDLDFDNQRYYDSSLGGSASLAPLNSYLSISRASTGYAKTSAGTLTSFGNDALRITDLGLLVEDARTNSALRSQEFDNATWNNINSTDTADQSVAPDGTTTMDKIDDGTVASDRHTIYQQFLSLNGNVTRTLSIFAKDNDRRFVQLLWLTGAGSIEAVADLQLGTITQSGVVTAGTGTSFVRANIEAFTNGVYRISLTGIAVTTASTDHFFMVALSDTGTPSTRTIDSPRYTGSNKSIYVWGSQLEDASFLSSYIPTVGGSATRARDAVTFVGSALTLATTLPGTMLLDVMGLTSQLSGAQQALVGDNSGSRIYFYFQSDTSLSSFTGSQITVDPSPSKYSTGVKIALAQASGARSLTGGGVAVVTSATANAMGAANSPSLGAQGVNDPAFAYIRRCVLWNSKLADATLQSLTAP